MPSRIVLALLGVALLLAGRRLFWLAVGALGFLAGYRAMAGLHTGLPPIATIVVALAVGVLGIVLAVVVQRVAVALAGFFLGVVLMTLLLPLLGLALGPWNGLVIAAGGLVMAFVALGVFSLALEVLTAGAGAALLVDAFAPGEPWAVLLLVALWVLGVLVQRRSRK
jgi:hypothetical protein